MFSKKTIKDIDLAGKTVLVRVDYNVPLDALGNITDDYRVKKSLPTIEYLQDKGCKIILCSHLGRPNGHEKALSLKPVADILSKLIDKDVLFAEDSISDATAELSKSLKQGQILLLENLRFYEGEEKNDETFAKKLAGLAEIFVQDGFGVVHRASASTEAITRFLPSVAGLLVEKEVDTITEVMESPKRPLMALVGGAKISDKIKVINKLVDIADFIAVGGAMANTFLLAQGVSIGKSKSDPTDVPLAREILERAKTKAAKQRFVFYIPQDGVVARGMDKASQTRIVEWSSHLISSIESYPRRPSERTMFVEADEMILDIGPVSGSFIAGSMQLVSTVIWNGTMGVTEVDGLQGPVGPFAHGTELIIDAMTGQYGNKPFTLVGGGDTVGYVEERKLTDSFGHVSTGGGASLELMSGAKLPGVEALMDKE